ncbi:hypothetical protein M8J77_000086, partial [Diaphorina citri]
VVAIDNFVNSVHIGDTPCSIRAIEQFTGKKVDFYSCDLVDKNRLGEIFAKHDIDCVIHFAAVKAVGESMQEPLMYYKNNLIATINLLEVMKSHGVYQLVFSSSCTVYGEPQFLPITEDHPTGNIKNVYGKTKHFIEEMLKDLSKAHKIGCVHIGPKKRGGNRAPVLPDVPIASPGYTSRPFPPVARFVLKVSSIKHWDRLGVRMLFTFSSNLIGAELVAFPNLAGCSN